ncbi:MAG TPA: biotin--[acetyl-CoA-carboxylase] ligase [Candidatus Acidoferrales bacterium]|nr:biotin--[acetyl-CoA-carboxylase] ligase [Candidatus Acidoferrales bacterium]
MMDLDRLRAAFPGRPILYYPSLDSTMRAAAGCERGTIVIAGEQLAGQGRHGHAWHSEANTGLYCSIVLDPTPLLTLALGLATVEAIMRATGLVCDIRWPNDLMLGGRKTGGILVQLVDGSAIAGIGINVNQQALPRDLAGEATSLRIHTGQEVCATDILAALIPAVEAIVKEDRSAILRLFTHASSYAAGRRVIVHQATGVIQGTTAGLNPDGFLVVRQDDGTDTLILAGGVRAAGS